MSTPTTPKLSRSDQSRINGAKSKGPAPTTPTGKAASSRNALKHGLTAEKHSVLNLENPDEYRAVYNATVDEFRPHSLFALRLVEKLAHLDWRIERLALLETAYLDFTINESPGRASETDPIAVAADGTDDFAILVRGWIAAAGNLNALELLRRYTSTLQHQFNTTFANFEKLETRAIARRRDREQDPSFLDSYQKPEYPETESSSNPQPSPDEQPVIDAAPIPTAPRRETNPKPKPPSRASLRQNPRSSPCAKPVKCDIH